MKLLEVLVLGNHCLRIVEHRCKSDVKADASSADQGDRLAVRDVAQ